MVSMAMMSLIYSFNKYLWSASFVPGTVLSAWGVSAHETAQDPCPTGQRVPAPPPAGTSSVPHGASLSGEHSPSDAVGGKQSCAELFLLTGPKPSTPSLFSNRATPGSTTPVSVNCNLKIQTRNKKHGALPFQPLRGHRGVSLDTEMGITGLGSPSASGPSKTERCYCGEKLKEHEAHLHSFNIPTDSLGL